MSTQVEVTVRPARPPSALQLRRTHRHAQSFHFHCVFHALGPRPVDTGKRLVQLPDAGNPPRTAAAPYGPQFRLQVLKEDKMRVLQKASSKQHRATNPEERFERSLPIGDQRIYSHQCCPGPCESEHLSSLYGYARARSFQIPGFYQKLVQGAHFAPGAFLGRSNEGGWHTYAYSMVKARKLLEQAPIKLPIQR